MFLGNEVQERAVHVRTHPRVTHNVGTEKNLQSDSDHKMFQVQRQMNRCRELHENFRLPLKSRSDQGLLISEGKILGPLRVFVEINCQVRFSTKIDQFTEASLSILGSPHHAAVMSVAYPR